MKRLVCRSLATVGLIAVLLVPVAPNAVQAAIPNDQVAIVVTGSVTGMTSSPSFQPAFSPSIHDYAIYCQTGVNVVTFAFAGATPAGVEVSLGENQAAVVEASNGPFWVRCLPHDFPAIAVTGSASAVPGWYLTGNVTSTASSSTYAMVLDSNGTPVWYHKAPAGAINVEALPGDRIAWMPATGPGVGGDPSVGYTAYNLDTQVTQTIKAPIGPTDPHELLPMANGDYLMIGTPIRQMPVTYAGTSYSAIVDCVVQEVNSQGSLVWSWRASDHVSPASSVHATLVTIGGQAALDVYHCNSGDVDPSTGQVLLSMRNTSSVYLIERTNQVGGLVQDGPLIWKLEGCGNSQVDPGNEQVLTLQNDPEVCFDAQHDARFQPNGDVSLYDDHSYQSGAARGVDYSIDTASSSATWVTQYQDQPSGGNAVATGSFRRYANGSDNLVGWGFRPGSGFSEFDAAGNDFFSMSFPNGDQEYRVVKVPLNTLDINALRASAGLPRPPFPTVTWGSIGGVLTSKPAVAAWGPSRLDAFVRGTDGQLWHTSWTGTKWSGWQPLGGQIYPGTGPAVASWAPGRLDVFVEGTDRQMWHTWFDSQGWHGWQPLGGVLLSGPAASSWGPGHLDVVVEGTDHAIWHKSYDSGEWSPWGSLGGQTMADPGIASWGAGRADVFVKGTDNQLWQSSFTSNRWSPWQSLGGNLTSGPAATSLGLGLLDVVAAGANQEPERLPYNGGWQPWQPLGGTTAQTPAAASLNGRDAVFVTGTDRGLWEAVLPASGAPNPSATAPTGAATNVQAVNGL